MSLDAETKNFLRKILNAMELVCSEIDEVYEEYAEGDYFPIYKTAAARRTIHELEDELKKE